MSVTRRQFVSTCLTVTAASWTGQLMAENTSSHKPQFRIANKGGSIGSTYEEMLQKLRHYKSLGYDGIEGQIPGVSDTTALREAIETAQFPVHGIVGGLHWKKRLSDPDSQVRDEGREALIEGLKGAHAIGATSLLVVPGRVTGAEETHEDVWKRSLVELRKILPLAEKLKIQVLIENVWNGFCETPEEFRDYVDELESEMAGIYFDIGNVRRFGKPEDWIRLLGSRIKKLDVKDWGKKNSFCRLGEGDVDWPAVCDALKEIQYTGWATREGGDQSLSDTVSLMNQLLQR